MIEQDGWETVYYGGPGVRMLREETDAEFRTRIKAVLEKSRRPPTFADVPTFMRKLVPVEPIQVVSESARARAFRDEWDEDLRANSMSGGAKQYSPTRRWLRHERAREHEAAISADVDSVQAWRPSQAPALEIASRAWRVPAMIQVGFDGDLHVKSVVPARIAFPAQDDDE